jgi:peptidyl-prolyl cis-trans isomerase B (cyclophilin B)
VYRLLATLLALLTVALVAGCGDGDEEEGGGGGGSPAAESESGTTDPGTGCEEVDQPQPREDDGEQRPKAKLDPARRYDVTLVTTCGEMTLRMDVKTSPNATASFVSLAKNGYFEDTIFHRIVPGFVIQGGDPTASGSGGPGYSTVDKPPADTAYTKGVVAMAKAGPEPAGTAGSQFYVVTGEDVQLPPDYAVLGKVVKGSKVTDRIGRLGDPNSGEQGTPLQSVVIEEVRVDVSP